MTEPYDPNSEATNTERVIAAHWELLRRNQEFRAISRRWVEAEEFRRSHVFSASYHDPQHHTPRCAWDWMLTSSQRVQLAKLQIDKLSWFSDAEFNFGPIICERKFSPSQLTREKSLGFLCVHPMPDPPRPIAVDTSWIATSDPFKMQFRLACLQPNEFSEINARLKELGELLRVAGQRLGTGDRLNETPAIAHHLFEFGTELHELAEFSKVFKIPRREWPEQKFQELLTQIKQSFKGERLLVPSKKYDLHHSFQGTSEDWRWFLIAEGLGLDVRRSADLTKLAELYSEDLRARAMRGNAPRRVKPHGFTGEKIPGKFVKNRRRVVKQHVLNIERWIRRAYPPGQPETGASVG